MIFLSALLSLNFSSEVLVLWFSYKNIYSRLINKFAQKRFKGIKAHRLNDKTLQSSFIFYPRRSGIWLRRAPLRSGSSLCCSNSYFCFLSFSPSYLTPHTAHRIITFPTYLIIPDLSSTIYIPFDAGASTWVIEFFQNSVFCKLLTVLPVIS